MLLLLDPQYPRVTDTNWTRANPIANPITEEGAMSMHITALL